VKAPSYLISHYLYPPGNFDEYEDVHGSPPFRRGLLTAGKLKGFTGVKCRSRSGVWREGHTPDKDGKCVFCDQEGD